MMDEREFWLEKRKALLIEVQAIEKRWPSSTITVTLKRSDAEKLGLLESAQEIKSVPSPARSLS